MERLVGVGGGGELSSAEGHWWPGGKASSCRRLEVWDKAFSLVQVL